MFEERFQAARTADAVFDFLNFSMREFFPARPDWRVVPQPVEKNFDLAQRESHLARKADEEHAVECVRPRRLFLRLRWKMWMRLIGEQSKREQKRLSFRPINRIATGERW
jgi:hypothetical protein